MSYIDGTSYRKKQRAWLRENRIKPGDLVLVLRVAEDYEQNWVNSWNHDTMYAGYVLPIAPPRCGDYDAAGIGLGDGEFLYPYFVLEKIQVQQGDGNETE